MSVGIKIKRLREERKISQPELADLLEISQSTLSKIESGSSKKIDFLLMDKVCKIFDKDFEYFMEGTIIQQNNNDNSSQNILNSGVIYQYPENLLEQIKQLIEDNKLKDAEISELKKQLKHKD